VPLYEYECSKCHHRFERLLQRFSDEQPSPCPECGGPVSQLMSAPAIQFKGSGWYVTDYAKKNSSPSTTAKSKSPAESSSSTEGAAASETPAPGKKKTGSQKESPEKK